MPVPLGYTDPNVLTGYGSTAGAIPAPLPAAPGPTGGGGGGPVPVTQPQPGDVDPTTGNRWMPGHGWQPPNMFSDLNPGYGQNGATGANGSGGGGTGGGMGGANGGMPAAPGSGAGGIGVQGPGVSGLQLPDQIYQFIPQNLRSQFSQTLQNFLSGLGYTGQGNVGQYGERSYMNTGQTPNWLDPSIFGTITDPTLQGWVKWLFGERGLSQRVEQPGATAQGVPSTDSTGATAGSTGSVPTPATPTGATLAVKPPVPQIPPWPYYIGPDGRPIPMPTATG